MQNGKLICAGLLHYGSLISGRILVLGWTVWTQKMNCRVNWMYYYIVQAVMFIIGEGVIRYAMVWTYHRWGHNDLHK